MKKKFAAILLIAVFAVGSGSSQVIISPTITIVDWKGKNEGSDFAPEWLKDAVVNDFRKAKKEFGIPDSAEVFFEDTACSAEEGLNRALTKGKISCAMSITRNIARSHETEIDSLESRIQQNLLEILRSDREFFNCYTPFGYCNETFSTNKLNFLSFHGEYYSPFGYMEEDLDEDSEVINTTVLTEKIIYPKNIDIEKCKKDFDWVKNPENVYIYQYWLQERSPQISRYMVYTLMSIEKADWERIIESN